MTLTKTFSTKFGIALMTAILLVGMLGVAFTASAQTTADTCRVRANVSGADVEALTGGQFTAEIAAGTVLALDDTTTAGANALVCTYSIVLFVTNILFVIIMAVSILLIAWAAFLFVSAGSNPAKRGKARDFFIWAIVGLVVAALARVVPAIVRGLIGLN